MSVSPVSICGGIGSEWVGSVQELGNGMCGR